MASSLFFGWMPWATRMALEFVALDGLLFDEALGDGIEELCDAR